MTAWCAEQKYVARSLENVRALGDDKVEVLSSAEEIRRVCGLAGKDEWGSGNTGYVNWSSGWADAQGAMMWLREQVEKLNQVQFVTVSVKKVLIDYQTNTVSGVRLHDGSEMKAELTILAAGAWTASLIDLRGICKATGQVLCYTHISQEEEAAFAKRPTILNLSHGLFVIPPEKGLLKIARHGHGYVNPTVIPNPESDDPHDTITVSLPSPRSTTHPRSSRTKAKSSAAPSCTPSTHPSRIPRAHSSSLGSAGTRTRGTAIS